MYNVLHHHTTMRANLKFGACECEVQSEEDFSSTSYVNLPSFCNAFLDTKIISRLPKLSAMPPKKKTALAGLVSFGFTVKKIKKDNADVTTENTPEASASSTTASSTEGSATKTREHGQEQLNSDKGHGPGEIKDDDDVTDEPRFGRDMGPLNWTVEQWRSWKEKNPWLTAGKNGLGCSVCKAAKMLLLTDKTTGAHISQAWVNGTVSSPVQKQLRKKIYIHRDSFAHKRALEIADLKQKDTLPNKVLEQNAASFDVTASSFRAAYTVAKERMPYTKMTPIMKLNELNGAKVGPAHRSDHSCAAIVEHIAGEMKNKLVSHILTLDSRISITLDESTIHGRSYMIIYLRSDVTGNGDMENVFFDLIELEGGDAEALHSALLKSLYSSGLNSDFLKRNLISIATDGAAVLTGRQTGLIERLKRDFPQLQSVHCLAHRLELAVADSLKIVAGCNHFEFFISKLHSLYNQSTKNARELEKAAADLNMQILKIGKIFTIRWVASSFNTIKAVLKDFPVLARHFTIASEDDTCSGAERNKYAGLLKHLTSTGFLSDLAVMKDILRELQGLSLRLQRRDTSLVDASRQIHQSIEVLTAMKDAVGKTESKIQAGITTGQLKNVVLRETQPKINRGQFYQSIIDSLQKRLPDSELVAMLKPLDVHFWPTDRSDLVLFGDGQVGRFAKLIGESATQAIGEYRDWKLQGSAHGQTLKRLLIASKTVLPTSAECERGFSACNDTDNSTRNRLRAPSLTALLFVDLNGPPIETFNPIPFVKSWIKKGHRTSASWVPGRRPQPTESRALWSILSP
ncbi:hypothetical protein ACEWY4_005956 [Coilia grayii]|uniref:Uncharacterized protein n=1 Tax=Coilia grayii TaxID=363190 RepID=A0ABD1KC21_9TELE